MRHHINLMGKLMCTWWMFHSLTRNRGKDLKSREQPGLKQQKV